MMVRVETFYPLKIKKSVTTKSKVIEDVKDKRMRCYGSTVEECSAEYIKRSMRIRE